MQWWAHVLVCTNARHAVCMRRKWVEKAAPAWARLSGTWHQSTQMHIAHGGWASTFALWAAHSVARPVLEGGVGGGGRGVQAVGVHH